MTLQADSSIAGLPADVVAGLARDALNGKSDTSEAAFETLAAVARVSGRSEEVPSAVEAGYSLVTTWLQAGWTQGANLAETVFSTIGPGQTMLLAVLLAAGVVFLRLRARKTTELKGHDSTPHRRAYADAVTQAARLLASGDEPCSVARASGLARDVIEVVGSRRLVPAGPPGGYAAAEPSSGQKARGVHATRPQRVLR